MADAKKEIVDERKLTITKDGKDSTDVIFVDLDNDGKVLFNKVWLIKKEKDNFIADTNFRAEQLMILEKSYLEILQQHLEKVDGEKKKADESNK
jgi:lipopolysaccharide export LptBFGC system permease protein LptF